MTAGGFALAALLAAVVTLAAYMARVYAEFGRILARESEENLDAWEQLVEPRLGVSRERAALASGVLTQGAMGLLALELGRMVFEREPQAGRATVEELAQVLLALLLVVIFCGEVWPSLLFQRTRGVWVGRVVWVVRALVWVAMPVVLVVSALESIAALAEEPATLEEEAADEVEALLEAGEEEGILEESDRELVRSAVEFGDRLVKEVMTPRPEIFAVPESMTLEQFLETLREHNYSRVPVYAGTLDAVTGIAFAHDLLQIADVDAARLTVGAIQRPAALVPETKKGYELLKEMQREKQHMRLVIDEYGEVAGLVTIEDLLEEIVGDIGDEHEDEADAHEQEAHPDVDGAWQVAGSYPVARLQELAGDQWQPADSYESKTVGGLVSEVAGRIPLAGEVVEAGGLRLEVVASTDRLVERVRVKIEGLPQGSLDGDNLSMRSVGRAAVKDSGDAAG